MAVRAPGAKQQDSADSLNSLQGSPRTSTTGSEHDHNINELISQYSDPTLAAEGKIKQAKKNPEPSIPEPSPSTPRASTVPKISAKVSEPVTDDSITNSVVNGKAITSIRCISTQGSEMSEGEILHEPALPQTLPPTKTKEAQSFATHIMVDRQSLRIAPEPTFKQSSSRKLGDDALPHLPLPSSSKEQVPHTGGAKQEESRSRQEERQTYPSGPSNDRLVYPGPDKPSASHQELRDRNGEYRRPEDNGEQTRVENIRPSHEARIPTLAQLLPHNRDLKEWLEITGYHNTPYRDKIFQRRRAIAELDAQRNKLLAEMEAEERGSVPGAGLHAVSTPLAVEASNLTLATLPPQPPNQTVVQAEHVPKSHRTKPEPQRAGAVSNKRSYSDIQYPHGENGSDKFQRVGDGGLREEDVISQRPRRGGDDLPRRRSLTRDIKRDSSRPRYNEIRGCMHDSSQERDSSPSSRANERMRSFDRGLDEFRNRADSRERDKRPFVVRGNYRGRAFDPNYRGRGRVARV